MKYLIHPIVFIYYVFLFRNLFETLFYWGQENRLAMVLNTLFFISIWYFIALYAKNGKWSSRAMMFYWIPAIYVAFYGATH